MTRFLLFLAAGVPWTLAIGLVARAAGWRFHFKLSRTEIVIFCWRSSNAPNGVPAGDGADELQREEVVPNLSNAP